jgi:murein DD-endopeptidase MepM/ murein hydrolase activator NlpD
MSSLHQDRLLVEGSEPVTGTATALPTACGTSRRVVGSTEKKATSRVPTQRLGTAQRIGTTQSTAATPAAPRAKRAAGAKAAAVTGALASRAKAATVKAATAKAATAKAATAKAATAARAAAVTTVANHTAGVRSARAAAAAKAAPVAKPRATKSAAAKPAPAVKATAAKAPVAKAPVAKAPVAKVAAAKAAPVAKTAAAKAPVVAAPAAKAPAAKGAAPAKPVPAKAGPAKAAPAKAAPAKAAPANAEAAKVEAPAKPVPAKAAPAKAAAAKAAAKPARTKATSTGTVTAEATPRVRPTPHKRVPAAQALADSVALTELADLGAPVTTDVVIVRKDAPAGAEPTAAGRLSLFVRRRPPVARRRPALYLAAALVGAIGLSSLSAQEPTAQATTTMSQSVSVAEQLGIEATPTAAVVDADATEQLGELAASRATREAEQDAAMQVQAEADRVAVEAAAEAARPDAVLPVQGARLTSTFGARWGTLHAGIDLAAPMHTPEYAAMDGVVLEAGPASGFGLAVYIQHENGDVTVYGHMDKILVEAGQVVRAGDTIALLGNRGQSTGPHLHFEVHVGGLNGQKIDPLPWLRAAGIDI